LVWSVEEDDATDVAGFSHGLIALVDLVQGVGAGNEIGEGELAVAGEGQEAGDVEAGVAAAEKKKVKKKKKKKNKKKKKKIIYNRIIEMR
jgi:hypothetical protein